MPSSGVQDYLDDALLPTQPNVPLLMKSISLSPPPSAFNFKCTIFSCARKLQTQVSKGHVKFLTYLLSFLKQMFQKINSWQLLHFRTFSNFFVVQFTKTVWQICLQKMKRQHIFCMSTCRMPFSWLFFVVEVGKSILNCDSNVNSILIYGKNSCSS